MAKETTLKPLWPKRGIHGSNRDKSWDEVSNKHVATGRSKKTIELKDESQKEASRKRALTLMDSESSQQEAQPPKKVPKQTLCFQHDLPDKDLESSDHEVNVDELEQEDEVDELEDDNNMPQSERFMKTMMMMNTLRKTQTVQTNSLLTWMMSKGRQWSKVTELDDKEKATYLDKEVKHEQGGRPSSCCPHGSKLSKTSLASFKSANVCHLAKLRHHHLHQHVAMVEAFPFPVDRDELCWKLIQESPVKEPGLEQVLEEVEKEQNTKERLLDYIWGAATQIGCPTAYGLQGESLKGNVLFDVLKWLIQQGKLIHSGINAKLMTCNESKPWKNPIFLQLIKMQWWGPKGEGRHSEIMSKECLRVEKYSPKALCLYFWLLVSSNVAVVIILRRLPSLQCLGLDPATNPYLNAPATTLALVATVVEPLHEDAGGIEDEESHIPPNGTRKHSAGHGVMVHPVQKVSPPVFDFSGLEEAAKMELEGAVA
ncbi:hypothetical protein EDC04DRAFT_2977701 [Pisolithus marmoratus]|nr:hypothetical protein EDC04DRAFT_2977701 [Pisolithus marmoratus]